eukprot:TRINITY_DN13729_c0_g1_i5.p1 TRINITY_DN13729_c0_g1~~TRINITY_DN13729_c0_g1_i5.p1  ORF type:complete len:302 (-),score=72.01 TRINITY_DN13729_c0_g1_i5:365-1204(-)
MKILLLCLLSLSVLSQPTEFLCWNPQGDMDVEDAREQMAMLDSLVAEAKQMIEPEWQGLSAEEAAPNAASVINNTAITLITKEIAENEGNVSVGMVVAATIQAALNTTNGEEILAFYVRDPNNFPQLLGILVANFNFTCIDDPNVAFMQVVSSLLSAFFSQASKEQLGDIIVETGIFIAQEYNFTAEFLGILEPLTQNLALSDAIDSALLGLTQIDSDGLILLALQNTIGGLGLSINSGGVAEVIADFYNQMQVVYGIDGEEILTYVLDVFSRMVEGLQ